MEKLIKVGNLKQYVSTSSGRDEVEAMKWAPLSPAAPRAVINYIHGGPVDNKPQSKKQKQRSVHAAFVREQVSTVQCTFTYYNVRPINGPITFPLIDSNRMILPYEDALVLTVVLMYVELWLIQAALPTFCRCQPIGK